MSFDSKKYVDDIRSLRELISVIEYYYPNRLKNNKKVVNCQSFVNRKMPTKFCGQFFILTVLWNEANFFETITWKIWNYRNYYKIQKNVCKNYWQNSKKNIKYVL